jgi:predicted adenine nucleotide alpha hydrolase (AANH) superfamily ATPase
MRLSEAAQTASTLKYGAFTTTLLYSRYQKHEWIKATGERLARKYSIHFHYHDFRPGWSEGVKKSKALGMYRQTYCGCVYSERDRYAGVSFVPQNGPAAGIAIPTINK